MSTETKTGDATTIVTDGPVVPGRTQGADAGDAPSVDESNRARICAELQTLQRRRVSYIKARCRIDNELEAIVANEMGYDTRDMSKAELQARRSEARDLIEGIELTSHGNGKQTKKTKRIKAAVAEWPDVADVCLVLVQAVRHSRCRLQASIDDIEVSMTALAVRLPAAAWAADVRGFGVLRLAVIVGETGDLSDYANPAKVWKRMGCAPYKGKMGSTWKYGKEGKLSKEEWTDYGYNQRRRAIAYVIGDLQVKIKDAGYRFRYDEARAVAEESHPDWRPGRLHRHAMLLCVKRLLRDLWRAWRR